MTLPARCRVPKNARLAGFGHMNGYDLETQSWIGTHQVLNGEPRACRLSRPVSRPGSWPLDAPIKAMCGWSVSLTRFGVAKLRAAVRAMLKQYDGAGIQVATQCRITSLAGRLRKQTAILLAIPADCPYVQDIAARPWALIGD